MIRTLDRYVLRNFLSNYFLSFFVLISLYVILDLSFNMDEFTQSGNPILTIIVNIFDYYFFNLPLYFSHLSGVITLFAACATLARFQRQNEVIAVLASGTSLYRLALPIVLAGLCMNALLLLDHELILPQVAPKLAREREDVKGEGVYSVWCVKDGEHQLVSARQFSPADERIGGLIVVRKDPATGQIESLIEGDRAEWNQERGRWDFTYPGAEFLMDAASGSTAISGETPLSRQEVSSYESDLNPQDLLLRKSTQWLDFLSLKQLSVLEKRGVVPPQRVARVQHLRVTMAIFNMVLLLLGISFFMSRLPDSVLTQGAKALGVCALAFLANFVAQQVIGASGDFSAALPHWMPIFIFGPIAVLSLENVKT